ncbi:hypothetical protein MKW98_024541 [Papaver atlanticum]|uniref:Bulb-type lectin domain-containing protein n=1 Tax=Papaver atlanticum TaxID=357466 RepID=A0AAD4RV38_9MAGN|nr:hypothetical protein MKW98_024541 [Papaver atlanticum]
MHFYLVFFIIFFCYCSVLVQAQVPKNRTFRIINQGDYQDAVSEYGATFRFAKPNANFNTDPFGLYFYNTTFNAYVLGIGGGSRQNIMLTMADQIHWVWDANRNDPVREKATLTFGRNGNLVLADVDGRIVWQTYTANKGVTGISMKKNGNLVLHDKNGRFIWQSFQHPTDTLVGGQSLQLKGSNTKLVSRTSNPSSYDGPYSLVIGEKHGLMMYKNTSGKLVQYAGWEAKGVSNVTFHSVKRIDPVQPEPNFEVKGNTSYFLSLGFSNGKNSKRVVLKIMANTYGHYSHLRIESDGNLKVYSYSLRQNFPEMTSWEKDYAFFGDTVKECALRSKCGTSGKCYGRLCSACPRNGSSGCMITS